MLGGKKKNALGYTIVEVMIVLAVSGVMFIIAATFINGKQARTSFRTGVNGLASQIQDTIEQVTDGRYTDVPLSCSGGTPPVVAASSAPTLSSPDQGSHAGCTFVGKIINFNQTNGSSEYQTYMLVAPQADPASSSSPTLANTPITIVNTTNLVTSSAIPQALRVKCVLVNGTPCPTSPTYNGDNLGFVQSMGAVDTQSGSFQSGGQTINLVNANVTDSSFPPPSSPTFTTPSSISLCVTDGSLYATIDIGGNNASQLSANANFKITGTGSC